MVARLIKILRSMLSPAGYKSLTEVGSLAEDLRILPDPIAQYGETFLIRMLIDSVPDYLYIKDADSRFVIANDSVARDIGLNSDDLIGKNDFDIHDNDAAKEFFRAEQEIMRTGNPLINFEEPLTTVNGTQKWMLSSKIPIFGKEGNVIGLIGVARDITERKRAEAEALFLAHHDPLTSLPNRSVLDTRIDQALHTGISNDRWLAVVFLDVDNFKFINDSLGHAAGDEVLKVTARRIASRLGEKDVAVRIGGDEFVILLADQANDFQTLHESLEEMRLALSEVIKIGSQTAHVTTSLGCAVFPMHADNSLTLLKNADIAMYQAKAAGRNNLKFYDDKMHNEFQRRATQAGQIRGAL